MRVKDICNLQNGRAFKQSDWGSEGVPIIRIQNLNNESAPFNYYVGEYDSVHEIDNGELLFSWSGTPGTSFGAFRWYRGKGVLNQHIFKVIPKIEVNKDYLKYALNGNMQTIIAKAHGGVGLQHITKKELEEIDIPIIPLKEQTEIVDRIVQVERIIFMRKQELKKLDNLIKARFVELFGNLKTNSKDWHIRTFDELTCLITDVEHVTPRRTEKGIFLLSARNILNHSIQLENVDYIDQNEYERISKRVVPQEGDVLISCSGTVGRCCIVPAGLKFQMVRSVALLRFKKDINPIFAEYMVSSDFLQGQIRSSKTASSQANLFQGKIKALKGVVPPLELQNEFADFVIQVDKSKAVVQKALDETQLLFDSLMQEYFG